MILKGEKLNSGIRTPIVAFVLTAVAMLTGCGGGGGGGGATASISGTAATGAPIVGKVVAIDANGNQFTASTSASGAYTVNVSGGTAPFILTIVGTSSSGTVTLSSIATAVGQTVNITPLTDLIVSTAAGQPGGSALVDLCTPTVQPGCTAALTAATTGSNLSSAVTAVTGMIAPLNTNNTDPLNGTFTANGTGMDAVLDQILVAPATAQGAMATVTLIAVPGATLGSVTMPVSAGGTSTVGAGTATASDITAATTAASSLSEIQACMASFNALYATSTMPSASQVTPYFDSTFSFGSGLNQAQAITLFSTPATATAGTNGGFAYKGLTFTADALSDFDFSPQTSAAGVGAAMSSPALNLAAATPYAWVKMHGNTSNFTGANFKMVKGAAYAGCAGGWKMAGIPHVQNHMLARVEKNTFGIPAATTYTRSLPFHVDTSSATAEGIGSIVVTGPGLSVYSGNPATPVGTATPITLVTPPVPAPPAVQLSWMTIQGTGNSESIQSCQDLAAISASAGTPCYDETAVAPGAVFTWTAYDTAATPAVLYAFPYQINSVPLSIAFVQANDKDLYAQNISASPAGTSALNTAAQSFAVGANMDGVIKFNYTVSSVYGAQTNHCGIGITDATNTIVLLAEQNADRLPTQQSSCTFNTAGLNSGSLARPSVAFGGTNSYMYVTNIVLGNMLGAAQPY